MLIICFFCIWLIKTFPKVFLGFFGYSSRLNDFKRELGPKIDAEDLQKLRDIPVSQNRVSLEREKIEGVLAFVYDQRAMRKEGFDRALSIAVVYPLGFLWVFWLFSDSAMVIGEATLIEAIPIVYKIVSTLLMVFIFLFFKYVNRELFSLSKIFNIRIDAMRKGFKKWLYLIINMLFNLLPIAGFILSILTMLGILDSAAFVVVAIFAVAFSVAGTSFGAIAVAFIGVVSGATAFAVASTFVFATVFAVAALYVYVLFEENDYNFLSRVVLFCITAVGLTTPFWFIIFVKTTPDAFFADQYSFVILFFLATLPLINGLSDWLSVSFTQFCLSKYQQKQAKWWLWLTFDLLVAIVMLLALFSTIFLILFFMQSVGWGVDAAKMLQDFQTDEFNQQNLWILALVITNLAPTMLHLVFVVVAQFLGYFDPIKNKAPKLIEQAEFAEKWSENDLKEFHPNDYCWGEKNAQHVAFYLTGMPVIWTLLVISLLFPFTFAVFHAVTELLHIVIALVL